MTVTAPGYYPQAAPSSSFAFSLASFVAGLLPPQPVAPAGPDGGRRASLPLLQVGVSAALPALVQASGGVPKGYVRLLVFDADSNLVGSQTQQLTSAAHGGYESLHVQLIAPHDGYVTAYVGNERPADVYFDDVEVEHRQGLQEQESHYDPMGLELAGLAGTSPGVKRLSQYKWNGKEFQADLGLHWTQLDWQMFDAQLDWLPGVDPEVENGQESFSPYVFGFDNAVRFNDPNGRCPTCPPLLLPAFGATTAGAVTAAAEVVGVVTGAAEVAAVALGLGYLVNASAEAGGTGHPHYLLSDEPIYTSQAQYNITHSTPNSRTGNPLPKSQTNGGRAYDPQTKSALGGSGKPRPTTVNKGTYKEAKDAARNDRANGGRGTPVKHTKDQKGGTHFHNGDGPTGKGKESTGYGRNAGKVSNNVHYHYPEKSSN